MSRHLVVAAVAALLLVSAQSGRAQPACPRAEIPCPAQFYVSDAGDDANPGTSPEKAWRTLARVSDEALQPGDRVLLAGGQTFESPLRIDAQDRGEAERPVVVTSFGEGRATILAQQGNAVTIENTQGVRVENVEIHAAEGFTGPGSGVAILTDLPGNVKLDGITVVNVSVAGFDEYGIHVDGNNGKSGFKNLLIERVTAERNALGGIIVDGEWSETAPDYAHQNITVRDSRASNNAGVPGADRPHSGNGIILSDVDGGLIERCIADNNGYLSESRWGGPVGIWAWDVNAVTIQFNEAFKNRSKTRDGGGFDLDGGASGSIMQYNYSHENAGAGFSIISFAYNRKTTGNVIRYNISANDARSSIEHGGILIHGQVYDTLIYNNTVYLDANGLAGDVQPAALQIEPLNKSYVPGGPDPEGVKVFNNLLATADGLPVFRMRTEPGRASLVGNAYFSYGQPTAFIWNGDEQRGLDAFRDATGQERLDGKNVGVGADPKMRRPDSLPTVNDPDRLAGLVGFRIEASSPLVDAGLTVEQIGGAGPAVARDFLGQRAPRGRAPDIGAYEVGGRP